MGCSPPGFILQVYLKMAILYPLFARPQYWEYITSPCPDYNPPMTGRLYLIGTPIGNLADFSPRALTTLTELDVLFCEDTRTTAKLLNHFGVRVDARSLSDDSPDSAWGEAVALVKQGLKVGYVSEAGMPGLSDPGRRLVRAAWVAGETPVIIPGPSAVGTLLAACPFISRRFLFLGFAPRKKGERESFLDELAASPSPCFFFESPHRAHRLLEDLTSRVEPKREIMLGREMTKLFEQVLLFSADQWPAMADDVPQVGEFTIAVDRAPAEQHDSDAPDVVSKVRELVAAGFSQRDAIRAAAIALDVHPNEIKKLVYSGPDVAG
jgi:16S rRNA (cytidine1402-2'-O)-methyltransferase